MNLESGVLQVHIEDIIPNRFQPRLNFDEQGLKELSDSIKEHGIIQPLVLRKLGDKYEIIAGERRYKAAQMAGLSTVPAVIANIDDNKSAEVALVENVQRRDLTAIEEARSYKSLLDKGYLTQEQLAKRMGLSQPSIANKLRLLNLDEEVQQALLEEKISERHARTLLSLEDKAAQKEWLHRIINERLTVRQLDMELKKLRNGVDDDTEDEGVPLVSSMPSIDDIKANAVDISMANSIDKPVKEPVETLDMLEETPSMNQPPISPFNDMNNVNPINPMNNQMGMNPTPTPTPAQPMNNPFPTFNDTNSMQPNPAFTTATTVPDFNITAPTSASSMFPTPPIAEPSPSTENKFFDIGNLSALSVPEQPASPEPSFVPLSNRGQNTGNLEIFDDPTSKPISNPFQSANTLTPEEPKPATATPMNPMDMTFNKENNMDDFSFNNKYFTPPTVNTAPEITVKEPTEKEVDPMDAVAKLENPSLIETPTGKMDLKDAIAFMRKNIESLGEKGFYIDVEEIDFDSTYQITMRIHKDN